jgi:uncharacterized protein
MANGRHLETLLLIAAALWVATCGAQPGSERSADERPSLRPDPIAGGPGQRMTFMWRATPPDDPRKIVYLFGSIHVARQEFYPLDPAVEEAFDASDALALEMDPTNLDPKKIQMAMIQRALLPEGETLKDRVSHDTWAALVAWLEARGLPLGAVSNYEPWFAALMVNQIQDAEIGLDPSLGVDRHFIDRAGSVKPIEALETLDTQLDVFDGLSRELQEWVLVDMLDDLSPEERAMMEKMIDAWKSGDGASLHELVYQSFTDDPRGAPLYDALFKQRNEAMADGVDALLETWNHLFVVVGAGHLVGDDGVVALLERRGYRAEQVPARGR